MYTIHTHTLTYTDYTHTHTHTHTHTLYTHTHYTHATSMSHWQDVAHMLTPITPSQLSSRNIMAHTGEKLKWPRSRCDKPTKQLCPLPHTNIQLPLVNRKLKHRLVYSLVAAYTGVVTNYARPHPLPAPPPQGALSSSNSTHAAHTPPATLAILTLTVWCVLQYAAS
ncbi:hypothetical protein XELAEV_18002155mg [Xenopus laevis]|uniref:Uncharacterized protein n=1 Tax=Xenopus laevis TaxID=8355 RepID=A0A974GZ21_XENLA|nr:hypothetical protein XELAEV_18002155mg [Xenopus laevis]